MEEIFHSGEREVQRRTGEIIIANSNGRIINNVIVAGAINFIEKQPMVIVSSIDSSGNAWASLLIGDFGFAKVNNPKMMVFDKSMLSSAKEDIFYQNIEENHEIGSLFVELSSRRRFRINGTTSINKNHIEINIHEAYPNCPKYIQRRVISVPDYFENSASIITHGNQLKKDEKDWILNADTIFVASLSNNGKMDVSHRGGNPGFIEIIGENTLKIPDYQGNSMYNTLGNFIQNPNSGILLVNFEKGETLQLTGKADLLFDQNSEEDKIKTTGTGRYWLFKTKQWIYIKKHHKVDWELLDYSPFNP
jgi:uncharacterized protein